VTLSAPTSVPVTVQFATVAGTATAGSDFVATAGSLTLDPGSTSTEIIVPIVSDRIYETDEVFEVHLSGAVNAQLGDAVGQCTIKDDDPPGLSVAGLGAREPKTGQVVAGFQVTLAPARATEVSVSYATHDQTATAPADYLPVSGRLVFAPGEVLKVVPVTINTDDIAEPTETFVLSLSDAAGADIVSDGVGRIIDRDAAFFFAVAPCRLYDSRVPLSPLGAGQTRTVPVAGACGIPSGVKGVALNVTVTEAIEAGHIALGGESTPSRTSTLNFTGGQTRGNNAVVSLAASQSLYVSSGQAQGSVHFILDVAGYFQ
jgi:hypothetical protein